MRTLTIILCLITFNALADGVSQQRYPGMSIEGVGEAQSIGTYAWEPRSTNFKTYHYDPNGNHRTAHDAHIDSSVNEDHYDKDDIKEFEQEDRYEEPSWQPRKQIFGNVEKSCPQFSGIQCLSIQGDPEE